MTLTPGTVYNISYDCTPRLGYEEYGQVRAYWTGDVDTWGKLTLVPVEGVEYTLYLFRDELVEVWPVCGMEANNGVSAL